MRTLVTTSAIISMLAFLSPTVVAEDEQIGDPLSPVSAVFGQPIDLNFPNIIHPPPHRKVMSFTGMAQASGQPRTAILGIHFDYIDPNNPSGPPVVIPSPNFYMEAIPTGGGFVQINAGPVQLINFCPDQVSIHFENLTDFIEIEFYGTFNHTCVPIPEPSSMTLLLLCGVASLRWRRRLR
ncbi:PEP-CTERM sorting domain-containing protein [Bythopirellula polymerisocia]|uniref:Ice-binding protein C-terminal domain-containing protein n=1 Tax=Bythopirellula polymerisocia TaxID=2528003 RepID=A0A5C6C608_9BACT|nr:PEP-CTERM sorting domain-containing protein [Bythopirellula polymerisocia]TWU20080.1 hypothetical protein Pla144_50330 [Bythopirellula polymerisocia]